MKRVMGLRALVGLSVLLWGIGSAQCEEPARLSFNQLAALDYEPSPPDQRKKRFVRDGREYLEQYVPAEVLNLDGKEVEIVGYMLPIAIKNEKVSEFMLMADTAACCFGVMPAYNEFVFARAKKGVNLFDNVPIRIRGRLSVKEVWQEGFFSHLYFMEVEALALDF